MGRNIDGSWHIHESDDEAAFPTLIPLSLPPHILDLALSSRRTISSHLVQADIHSVGFYDISVSGEGGVVILKGKKICGLESGQGGQRRFRTF